MKKFKIEKESGLKMTVLKEGAGDTPKIGETVLMHYEIWMNEGTMTSNYDYEKEEYIQYETSSFCKKGYESKHNSGYWKRKKFSED